MDSASIDAVNRFWFEELDQKDWFRKSEALDATIKQRFGALYESLKSGVPDSWLATPEGCLAAVLVLDQFPRNIFRGDVRSFESDAKARAIAKQAVDRGLDTQLPPNKRWFLYLPFEHSEDGADQALCVQLIGALGNPLGLDYALRHKAVIDRFGRFPHRNEILGRQSTEEEDEFLREPGSSF